MHERGRPLSKLLCGANLIMGYESERTVHGCCACGTVCILHIIVLKSSLSS